MSKIPSWMVWFGLEVSLVYFVFITLEYLGFYGFSLGLFTGLSISLVNSIRTRL